jgi:hypothetical protein
VPGRQVIAALRRWWFADAPAERLAALRILVGAFAVVYVASRVPELLKMARLPDGAFRPTGIVRLLPGPLPVWLVVAIAAVTLALLVAFTLGAAFRITAPAAAVALLVTLSYRTSWGQIFHTENLLVLHVFALACAPAADVWAFGASRGPARDGYGWPIKLMLALTVATYVLAGIAKLRLAGVAWLDGDQLRNQIALDNLRKAVLGEATAPLARPLLAHPVVLDVLSVTTLVVELGAPVALLGNRLSRAWAVGAWLFHVGVLLAMNILFPYPLFGLAFAPLFPVERIRLRRKLRL